VGRAVLDGLRKATVRRLVVVGGAGSLEVAPGVRVIDNLDAPEVFKLEVLAQARLLEFLRDSADDLEWTYISPGGTIEPGVRTGVYRVGGDRLLIDDQGNSRISAEDYAIALVDELDNGENIRRRINIAY
jgi:uncharacterized protein